VRRENGFVVIVDLARLLSREDTVALDPHRAGYAA
jgi:purine-binding chemotaxis protein CheW